MSAGDLSPALIVVYDLRNSEAWEKACRHGRTWGRRFTHLHILDADHIALVFRPTADASWRSWEQVRAGWILGELAA
jgi:hypothetical protein